MSPGSSSVTSWHKTDFTGPGVGELQDMWWFFESHAHIWGASRSARTRGHRHNVSFHSHFLQPGQEDKSISSKITKGRGKMGAEVSWLPYSQFSPFNSSREKAFSFQVWNSLTQSGWSLKEAMLVHVSEAAAKITTGTSFSLHIPPTLPLRWFRSQASLCSKRAHSSSSFSTLSNSSAEEMRTFSKLFETKILGLPVLARIGCSPIPQNSVMPRRWNALIKWGGV